MSKTKVLDEIALQSFFIKESSSLLQAIEAIEQSGYRIAIALDDKLNLKGILTDTDIRRCIIQNKDLNITIKEFINIDPIKISDKSSVIEQIELMDSSGVDQLLLVDNKKIKGLRVRTMGLQTYLNSSVAIMAGGLGTRLKPLTNKTPKPLIKVKGIPLIDRLIRNLSDQGFDNFIVSTNHMGEKIKAHLGSGDSFNVNIDYITEKKKMGTVGSLTMLRQNINFPLILVNADILINFNFRNLLDFHEGNKNDMTVCVKQYGMTLPYGLIESENYNFLSVSEKPTKYFDVNTGIYVLNKKVVDLIPKDTFYDATTLLQKSQNSGMKIGVHHTEGDWKDIGTPEDLERVNLLPGDDLF